MEKAIYGLAMPFNDSYMEYDVLTNTWTYEKTYKAAVELDRVIGATFAHDYLRELGRTDQGTLFIHVNERGLFFKVVPITPIALSIYKKVKRGAIRHCSVSYAVREKRRNIEEEGRIKALSNLIHFDSNIVVQEYKRILVFEVCVGNHPANEATFCTVDKDHPLLKGVRWDEN